jgi:hypothetical protein
MIKRMIKGLPTSKRMARQAAFGGGGPAPLASEPAQDVRTPALPATLLEHGRGRRRHVEHRALDWRDELAASR